MLERILLPSRCWTCHEMWKPKLHTKLVLHQGFQPSHRLLWCFRWSWRCRWPPPWILLESEVNGPMSRKTELQNWQSWWKLAGVDIYRVPPSPGCQDHVIWSHQVMCPWSKHWSSDLALFDGCFCSCSSSCAQWAKYVYVFLTRWPEWSFQVMAVTVSICHDKVDDPKESFPGRKEASGVFGCCPSSAPTASFGLGSSAPTASIMSLFKNSRKQW